MAWTRSISVFVKIAETIFKKKNTPAQCVDQNVKKNIRVQTDRSGFNVERSLKYGFQAVLATGERFYPRVPAAAKRRSSVTPPICDACPVLLRSSDEFVTLLAPVLERFHALPSTRQECREDIGSRREVTLGYREQVKAWHDPGMNSIGQIQLAPVEQHSVRVQICHGDDEGGKKRHSGFLFEM